MTVSEPTVAELFSLEGRTALITGGSAGLGRSIALGFAQAGAATVLASRTLSHCEEAAEEISSRTGTASSALEIDVTDEASVIAAFGEATRRFGRLDVLVNCAGFNSRHLVTECPADVFERVVRINLTGTWLCCREAGRVMGPLGRGSVINLGSALSAIGMPARTPYCSSKAAIIGLTQTLALEWAGSGLRCNALCPGPFRTAMNEPVMVDPAREAGLLGRIALHRWAEFVEIRGPAVFLASDASSYMTGAALYVDGGWTAG